MSDRVPDTIPLSLLNALEYCPRRFYYEFVQGEMLINEFVLEGTLQHQRTDTPGQQTIDHDGIRTRRVHLCSERLHLSGFADLVEEVDGLIIPVEYKHGKEGKWLNDHVQLCAQALCLEEQIPDKLSIAYGYIFYFGSRKRVQVQFTPELRAKTLQVIERALQIAMQNIAPSPLDDKLAARCRDCSLRPLCLPEEVKLLMKEGSHAYTLPD